MRVQRITKRAVDAAQPRARAYLLRDQEVRGFCLVVTPGGAKSYAVDYRAGHGRNSVKRRLTIGKRGPPWTPEQARAEAKRLLGLIADGEDPAETRKAAARQMTFADLCVLYLVEGVAHKKPRTLLADNGRIEHHLKPLLGAKRFDEIERGDIERLMRDVMAGKTAVREPKKGKRPPGNLPRGGKGVAGQCVALVSTIMSFAVARGLLEANMARGVKKPPTRKMERFLSEAEIARLAEALDAEAARANDPYPVAAIKLLLFTGCRRGEVLGLQWGWIDFERAMVMLPDSKTGRKPVYLNAPALDVLAGLPRQQDNPYVICGRRIGQPLVGLDKVWVRVRKAARLEGVRLHDLRHSFASIGAASGDSLLVIGKLLGHRHAVTTARYAHLSADPVRQAAEAIGKRIEAAMQHRPKGEVVELHRAAG
ncbi:MAG: site-specific integrase [Rhodospirillales bacterium]|nr:site-specific integrase [Rhodospirillales bacterium]